MFGQSAKHDIMLVVFLLFLPLTNSCSDQPEAPSESAVSSQKNFSLGLIPEQDLFSQKRRADIGAAKNTIFGRLARKTAGC